MANHEWIEKYGKKILLMRVASQDAEELTAKIEEFSRVIREQPEHSVLAISDVANGHFDKKMKSLLSDFVKANEPYIKMSVIVGIDGLQRVIYNGVLRATGRKNLVIKESQEEAIAYLTAQE